MSATDNTEHTSAGAKPPGVIDVVTDELTAQVDALSAAVDQIGDLVESARRLAEHQPKLGTAPPAVHLSTRLRAAAGQTGLSGEVSAADAELDSFHRALEETADRYEGGDKDAEVTLSKSGEGVHDSR